MDPSAAAPVYWSPSEDALRFAIPPATAYGIKSQTRPRKKPQERKAAQPSILAGRNLSLRDESTATKRPSAQVHAAESATEASRRNVRTGASSEIAAEFPSARSTFCSQPGSQPCKAADWPFAALRRFPMPQNAATTLIG